MNETNATPQTPGFKDRRTGLIIFGILEILLGAGCALMIPLMILAQGVFPAGGGTQPNPRIICLVFGAIAATLVWLGIGSIKCRRWARTLLLILSWSMLVMGILGVAVITILLPLVLGSGFPEGGGQGLPSGAQRLFMLIPLLIPGALLVAITAVAVFFYRSPHVKATCEARDPVPRWTDACPAPVLAVTLWLWIGGVVMLSMLVGYNGVIAFFGSLISGVIGGLMNVALAALWFWLGWQFYKLRPAGWWILMAVMLLQVLSNVLTFTRVDPMEMYEKMGYAEAQIEMFQKQAWISRSSMLWLPVGSMVPIFGYLIWVKRFFGQPQGKARIPAPQ